MRRDRLAVYVVSYRDPDPVAVSETYIPTARDATVAYFGLTSPGPATPRGVYRTRCVRCCDESPLAEPHKIYGDLFIPSGPESRATDDEECDTCGVSIRSLGEQCQRDHEEQQARWARQARIDHVIEMGMVSMVRCRVY